VGGTPKSCLNLEVYSAGGKWPGNLYTVGIEGRKGGKEGVGTKAYLAGLKARQSSLEWPQETDGKPMGGRLKKGGVENCWLKG